MLDPTHVGEFLLWCGSGIQPRVVRDGCLFLALSLFVDCSFLPVRHSKPGLELMISCMYSNSLPNYALPSSKLGFHLTSLAAIRLPKHLLICFATCQDEHMLDPDIMMC